MSHLSYVESFEVELPNADSILEESETEELISLAQQHFSLKHLTQQSPATTSSGLAEMEFNYPSARPFHSSERPIESGLNRPGGAFPPSDRHLSLNILRSLRLLPPLEETIVEDKSESYWDQPVMVEDNEALEDLSELYDDLSLFGILQPVFCVKNPSAMDDFPPKLPEQSNISLSKTLATPREPVSELHRVKLYTTGSPNEAMAPVAEATGPSSSLPTVVTDLELSDDEESRSLQLHSNDGQDDVDRATIPAASSLDIFHNNSMGKNLHGPCYSIDNSVSLL